MIQLGAMPLPAFVRLHPESRVSPEELDVLKEYLAPWATAPSQLGTGQTAADNSLLPRVSLAGVEPEFNGLAFDADFESWKLIGTTDRGDNNTFRFILGNEVAVGRRGPATSRHGQTAHDLPRSPGNRNSGRMACCILESSSRSN